MKRHTESLVSLFARRDVLIRTLAEAEIEINRIDREIDRQYQCEKAAIAREYARSAAAESRDNVAPRSYADLRGY